ncbi:glutamate-cysteine ligase-domain-containing protein, partial [Chytriomyces sp. MP71]
MGLLTVGTPLAWSDAKKHADHVRAHGIQQLLNVWHKLKGRRRDQLLWGDEIEYLVVSFDAASRTVKAASNAYSVLLKLEEQERAAIEQKIPISWSFKPEYGRYMLEGTPAGPYGSTLDHLLDVEPNMVARRKLAAELLPPNEALVSVTNFPLLGVNSPVSFLEPAAAPTPLDGASKSLFIPDEAINPHPRFRTLTANIRERRESKVSINVPIYKDINTPSPFLEPLPPCMEGFCEERKSEVRRESLSYNIYMDCMCFGMGCCCLQVTFQACSVEEARKLYDQLAPLTPIMMALSAGAPIFRGYLADVDCRWNVISASVDDRTKEERGIEVVAIFRLFDRIASLKLNDRFQIPKSRYASISTYLS